MTYEIGQKVETPFGVCKVMNVDGLLIKVEHVGTLSEFELPIGMLSLYKTAHDKLLSMGFEFEEVLDWAKNPFSHNWKKDGQKITIYLFENTVTTYEVCKEAIEVLTQYLEEMAK